MAGDQGFLWFDLNGQTVTNFGVPDGFDFLAPLEDGTTVCCLASRKVVARALKTNGSNIAIYDLKTGDLTVVDNPKGITSVGPANAAKAGGVLAAGVSRLVFANSRSNTVAAVAYNGAKQVGILVVRIP